MNQQLQGSLLTRKPTRTSQVLVRRQDYNSKIRKSIANVLTTNLQFKISGLGINVIQKCYVS
jgi:hypothetical protein